MKYKVLIKNQKPPWKSGVNHLGRTLRICIYQDPGLISGGSSQSLGTGTFGKIRCGFPLFFSPSPPETKRNSKFRNNEFTNFSLNLHPSQPDQPCNHYKNKTITKKQVVWEGWGCCAAITCNASILYKCGFESQLFRFWSLCWCT